METNQNRILLNGQPFVKYFPEIFSEDEMRSRSEKYFKLLDKRRSVREFSTDFVPKNIIENIIKTASTAPSGAHHQPWTFCAVSNADLKHKIRLAAEAEEEINYKSRMSDRWKKDLVQLGTDMNKPFLDEAPWLIVVFKKLYDFFEDGQKQQNYYVSESVGIACGLLITAIHNAGLVTLTHTPSPMNFLETVLNRPTNEKAFLLLPVGYAKQSLLVPDLKRKSLEKISVFYE